MLSVFAILFILQCASATIILDCTYSIERHSVMGNVYQCKPKVIKLGETNKVIGVSDNHQTGKTNQDVNLIDIYEQRINSIPEDINLYFASLEGISFYNCPIKSVTKDDLKHFPKLKYFRIAIGQLTTIEGDIFKHSPQLQFLDFDYNQIIHVGTGIFKKTPKLATAYFINNLCISTRISNNATAVATIANQLALKCPPSVEMIEEIILAGDKFKTAVKIQTTELEKKIEKLENVIHSLTSKLG